MSTAKLDADWLSRVMAEVASDYAMMFGPEQVTVYDAPKATVPLEGDDAVKL